MVKIERKIIALSDKHDHYEHLTEELTDGELQVILKFLGWIRQSSHSNFKAVKSQDNASVDIIVSDRIRYPVLD